MSNSIFPCFLDGGVNVLVTGRSDAGASHDDFLTIRYRDIDP